MGPSAIASGSVHGSNGKPSVLEGLDLDHYLVLRGGILMEETWIAWLTEYLEAHR